MRTLLYIQKNNFLLTDAVRKMVNRILLLLIGCTVMNLAQSQADNRLVMAEQYFAAGDYFTAAGLYEQFLHPAARIREATGFPLNVKKSTVGVTGKYGSKTDIMFRQADCYRLSNYFSKAADLYRQCFEKDPARFADALYWHAVCLRSTGNYAAAEESLNRFLNEYGNGNPLQESALKEKANLLFIKNQFSKPDSILYHVYMINSAAKGLYAPFAFPGNQLLLTATQKDSVAAGSNPYHNRLFLSTVNGGNVQALEPVRIEGLDLSFNQGSACLSPDGNYLYYTQWKKENGKTESSIFYSIRLDNGWSEPKPLTSVNQAGYSSRQPQCSGDGKYLFFASDRPGGLGNFDIWYAPIQAYGQTGEARNAGELLNTAANELAPFYHTASSTIVFASDRNPGMGGYDLYSSKGSGMVWKTAENMGYPVNSPRDDIYFFAAGNGNLLDNAYFSSDRGSECCLGTYAVSKTPKKTFLKGIVRDCIDNSTLADVHVILKDGAGGTLQAITGADGTYSFPLAGNASQYQLEISREKYADKLTNVVIANRNESNWHTDTLYNSAACLEKKLSIKVENVVSIYFDFDKSRLTTQAMEQLDSIYAILVQDTTASLQVSGYTDGLGSVDYNKKLSDKRAKTCADYLVAKGLDPAKISFESFGACCPIEMELINGRDNPDGRSLNRRALININRE